MGEFKEEVLKLSSDMQQFDREMRELKADIEDKKQYIGFIEVECLRSAKNSCLSLHDNHLLAAIAIRRKQAKERILYGEKCLPLKELFPKNLEMKNREEFDAYKNYHGCLTYYIGGLINHMREEQALLEQTKFKLSELL